MASQINPDPDDSAQASSQLPDAPAEKFTLPTSSRPAALPPQVLDADAPVSAVPPRAGAASGASQAPADEAAVALVRQREAKARLLALRRIEWVAIALVTVLLGGAAYSWRSKSDIVEGRKESFNGSPLPFDSRSGTDPSQPGPRASEAEPWREAKAGEVKEASQAIKGQLDAFKRDDYEKAATWQSRDLKRKFGSVSAFRRAIRENYPDFASYKRVRFGSAIARPDGKALRIKALVQGPQGDPIPAEYFLVRESGAYRIAGVSGPVPRQPEEAAPPSPPAESA